MENPWQQREIIALSCRMAESYQQLLGHRLTADLPENGAQLAHLLYHAPFVLLAHDGGDDPRFIYANLSAQQLWEMPWEQFIGLPSRLSAEPDLRDVRAEMLKRVTRDGYIDDYSGVRISATGQRFTLGRTVVWNLLTDNGERCGQAATFSDWSMLDKGQAPPSKPS